MSLFRQPGEEDRSRLSHDGGGNSFAALFNGTAGNGKGGEGTEDDGRTFVGMAQGNTLEILLNPAKAPKGVQIHIHLECAGLTALSLNGRCDYPASSHPTPKRRRAAAL